MTKLHDLAIKLEQQQKKREEPFDPEIVHFTRWGPE